MEWAEYPSSRGSERRLARISRIPRGAIADWEEEPLLSGSADMDVWTGVEARDATSKRCVV